MVFQIDGFFFYLKNKLFVLITVDPRYNICKRFFASMGDFIFLEIEIISWNQNLSVFNKVIDT